MGFQGVAEWHTACSSQGMRTILLTLVSLTLPGQVPAPTAEGGWRRVSEPAAVPDAAAPGDLPGQINIPAGTWITMRVNDTLSSDRNFTGEQFTGVLTQPIVAGGFVMARRGQTVGGRIADARRAGRRKGTSSLAVELIELALADGQQIPVRTQLIEYVGGRTRGNDAATIVTTTGLGAAVGAAVDGGPGAAAGAGIGAAASVIGVLVTRGRATVVDSESLLTFRTLAPILVSTSRTAVAYQPVRQEDYEQSTRLERRPAPQQPGWYPPYWGGGWGGPWGWGGGWGGTWMRPGIIITRGGWGRGRYRRW